MLMDQGTWVLVADGEKFLLLRNAAKRGRVVLEVIDQGAVDNPPTRSQGTDRPGRLDHSAAGPSAVQETDWHRLEKERFAKDLADRLQRWALAGRYDALVLIADPRTLGVLRPDLHKAVQERLVAELDKDLTKMPVDEIEAALAAM
jgi:protein required for attachment to host cells